MKNGRDLGSPKITIRIVLISREFSGCNKIPDFDLFPAVNSRFGCQGQLVFEYLLSKCRCTMTIGIRPVDMPKRPVDGPGPGSKAVGVAGCRMAASTSIDERS